jgi:hypothetical protein
MKEISKVREQLRWVHPSALKMNYELRAAEELVATLRFRSLSGSFATAETAGGCWTFKRTGFLQTRATIRACGSEAEIATFKNNTWRGGGALTLSDGRNFLATTNLWQTHLEIQTEAGEVLIRLQTSGFWQTSADVNITSSGLEMPELPWMNLFAWYVIVMMQMMDGASVGALATT